MTERLIDLERPESALTVALPCVLSFITSPPDSQQLFHFTWSFCSAYSMTDDIVWSSSWQRLESAISSHLQLDSVNLDVVRVLALFALHSTIFGAH